jgi:hypothetical protein
MTRRRRPLRGAGFRVKIDEIRCHWERRRPCPHLATVAILISRSQNAGRDAGAPSKNRNTTLLNFEIALNLRNHPRGSFRNHSNTSLNVVQALAP